MCIDHVTYHVPAGTLSGEELKRGPVWEFFDSIGFEEIEPDDPHEHGWLVRWFERRGSRGPKIHLVETEDGEQDSLALGHFCVVVASTTKRKLAEGPYCSRDSGSGRIWLAFANLRVEVRS